MYTPIMNEFKNIRNKFNYYVFYKVKKYIRRFNGLIKTVDKINEC